MLNPCYRVLRIFRRAVTDIRGIGARMRRRLRLIYSSYRAAWRVDERVHAKKDAPFYLLWPVFPKFTLVLLATVLIGAISNAKAEDGYDLWMRYRMLPEHTQIAYRRAITEIVFNAPSPTLVIAQSELRNGLLGLLGYAPPLAGQPTEDGSVVIGTAKSSQLISSLKLTLDSLGSDGYTIRTVPLAGHHVTVIAANTDLGVLYGTFHFLKLIQTLWPIDKLTISSAPRIQYRILNHWDNLDGTGGGYAGSSIWNWLKLPDYIAPRYVDYARACASIGINGVVPTNVNSIPVSLSSLYLLKYAALADAFRPYGVRIYLPAPLNAPIDLGGLHTADPKDPTVRHWWMAKVEEIYRLIPDFGGFLVKANSEGQPGPEDYARTPADGANFLAAALAPHRGIVMWRTFVYSDQEEDRAKQAFDKFSPLDGTFRDNVLLQTKNGPIDFQPREPFNPLFGAMPHTSVMVEFEIMKEYLGFSTSLVYLGPLFEETLRSDTYARGKGSTVARVVDGSLFDRPNSGMAGVANIGSDRNWTGSTFDQANWYAFGRFAWNPTSSARDVAEEWVRMTFSNDPAFVTPVLDLMMGSREAAVNYMTPLGLHHQMTESHYGPAPWLSTPPGPATPAYFNKADANGIGFDRTSAGSNAIAQYAAEVGSQFNGVNTVPESLLLWFHHLPWDFRMPSGNTLWTELVTRYSTGVKHVGDMRSTWAKLEQFVDPERFSEVSTYLAMQEKEAKWWRDASIAYFQSLSKRSLPPGVSAPEHDLQYYENLCFPFAPAGNGGDPWCK